MCLIFGRAQRGFSFIELMMTIAIVGILSGMGIAIYSQYQQRAYSSTALQVGLQLRTAFEAGLSDNSITSSGIFTSSRLFSYNIDGSLSCLGGCADTNVNNLFPGFQHQPGLKLLMNVSTTPGYTIQSGHCKERLQDDEVAGWLISDESASIRTAVAINSSELSQCKDVLDGGGLNEDPENEDEPTPTETPSPCDPYMVSQCVSSGGDNGVHTACTCICPEGTFLDGDARCSPI